MTVRDAATAWHITERRVNELCRSGRIAGAYKRGKTWTIPSDAVKPADERYRQRVPAQVTAPKQKPLPIGVSDYRDACTNYYYVDKTLLIRDLMDERAKVSLFTRPRRFGKTLNMDMLRTFFEKTDEDTSRYFVDKKIWACGDAYRTHQGRYPVIFLSFKDIKYATWDETFPALRKLIAQECRRHSYLLTGPSLSDFEKQEFSRLAEEKADEVDVQMSLLTLTQLLHKHDGISPIILIDEYDTPIEQGHLSGYYDTVVSFMRNLFSGGLKDNPHLSYGFLTGILRVAKESIFSGLNNLKINSVLDECYSAYFGFTADEVRQMTLDFGVPDKYGELCDWYDGYRFGDTGIFNPWSVVGYFNNGCHPKAFWQSTGSNDVIHELLSRTTPDISERLMLLMKGRSFVTHIDTGVIYPQILKDPSSVYSFLLVAGYLKAVKSAQPYGDEYICEVALPNKEIGFVYRREILSQTSDMIPATTVTAVEEAMFTGDVEKLKDIISRLLLRSASSFDTGGENFYHGFMLGICALFGTCYVTSNRESGDGRYDICLEPKKEGLPGVIIELKAARDAGQDQLSSLAAAAIRQINEKKYDTAMKEKGIRTIYRFGVAFSGKNVEITIG